MHIESVSLHFPLMGSLERGFPMISKVRTHGRSAPVLRSLWLIAAVALVGCGPPSKHEIVKKAEGVETKQELEAALGAPDDVDKLGPIERWTYTASDGEVEYLITGDTVALESTRDREEETQQAREPASP